MKNSTRILSLLLIAFLAMAGQAVRGQNVLNPADTLVTYNPSKPPAIPAYGAIAKWVRTVRMTWNTNNYKAYIYNGCQFRLHYPKSYNPTANDGKKYPMLIFDHGDGEGGTVYDNEQSLYHGGQLFDTAVEGSTFDGYVLVMQTTGSWGPVQFAAQQAIIDYMIANNKLDPFHITGNGLSAGGYGTWGFYLANPTYEAGIVPMSAVSIQFTASSTVNEVKYTPIWNINGGLDGAPAPYTAEQVANAMTAAGADYTELDMTTQGHDTWDSTWSMPAFWPFLLNAYCSNPWTLFGRTQFCPGTPINLTIGLPPGFQAYQWRMNGVVIGGATSNSINVTQIGTYDARVERNGNWSDWSHIPAVISTMLPTVTPPITVPGLMSKVIPAPDGNTGVTLSVPSTYATYLWEKVGSNASIGAANTIYANSPGQYVVQVTQQYGCSSNFSPPFTVVNANGPDKPDPASGVVVTPVSPTSLVVNWSQNPTPAYNETNFEIYQGTHTGGPYKLVAITGADVSKDTVTGLAPGTKYYYIIRAVDTTAASANSAEASGSTIADTQPPTAPGNLAISATTRTSITLSWTASTDNVGVTEYDVYVDGVKSYIVPPTQTTFTVGNLNYGQSYAFVVKAADAAGNNSAASDQVSGEPLFSGVTYQYFNNASTLTDLPNYTTLTPAATGTLPNVALTPATQTTYFGFLFQGYLHVTTAGTYNFRTTSDDGSKLYLGTLNSTASAYNFSGTAIVNNDGLHSSTAVTSSNITLAVGIYPIAIAYLQGTGSSVLTVSWKIPGSSSYVTIPNSAFSDVAIVNGHAPAAPSNLIATALSYNQVGLTWKDNSNNETGFEVWRSTSASSGYTTIGTVGAGVTSFIDSTVTASTRYYYEVRSVNLYGESPFASNYTDALWKFNDNYNDSSGNGYTLTAIGSPVFDATNKVEGTYALKLSGSGQGATIPNTGSFLLTGYNQLTVAGWVKASSATGSNRVIFDIGGSDNGLALLLNNTTLIAAVASGSTRSSISTTLSNSTSWNHIAVVYNGDSLMLYVNGVLAASSTSLSFHTLSTTTNGSRFGETNGTNAYNNSGSAFGGWIDDFGIYNTAFTVDVIQTLVNFTYAQSNATTLPLPAIPAAPTALSAKAISSSSINITWTNNAVNAANIQVFRSAANDQNYVQWAILPASATSFKDSGLYSDEVYYYEIRAVNAGGNSAFAPESFARTLDVLPVITMLPLNEQARYGTTTVIKVSATSASGSTLAFTAGNLPSFASLTDNGNGTAALTVTPAVSNAGSYPGLYIVVTDAFGGTDTTKFNLAVNNNYAPVLDSVANYTINEGDTVTIPLVGTNQNAGDTLRLSATGLPLGYTLTGVSNGVANLLVHPGYSAAGVYNVQVTINDNNGLSATRTFVLTVKYKNPNTEIFTRVSNGDGSALGAPWNPLQGTTTNNLLDSAGNTTTVGLSFSPSTWWNTSNDGSSTGNNSGVYPDVVLLDYMWFGAYYGGPNVINGTVTGLDTTQNYSLTFFSNSTYNGVGNNGTTTYTVGSQTVSLNVQNNQHNTASITSIKPQSNGTIAFSLGLGANTVLGYLNAIVITKQYNDGTAPAGISGLSAQDVPGKVQLSWTDSAYNAVDYEVWRALSSNGVYTLQGTAQGNGANSYVDSNITGNTAYVYKVRAANANGYSGFDSVSTTTLNRLPKIGAIANIVMKDTQSVTVNVTTTDDSTAELTLTATNLPPFASFTDNGNGTGVLTITPTAGTVGVYSNVTVTVTDELDSTASTSFTIAVTEPNVQSVYVNFTGGPTSPAPWNSLLTPPFVGTVMSNLLDDSGTPTGISATLVDGFNWFGNTGWVTGNSDAIYPTPVVQNFVYDPTTSTRPIQINGLNDAKQYNFVFFNSQWDGTNGMTAFTIDGQTDSLQADWNINKTVQINGIIPVNGSVTINVNKAAEAVNLYLNSIVIQGYDTTAGLLLNPTGLITTGVTQTTVKLQWQDRSAIETGYEVWRASDSTGSYSLVASLPANTVTYRDTKLSRGVNYYYIVRAVNNGTYSNYSNVLAVTTYSDAIYVAINDVPAAPSPWNNLNNPGSIGATWNNFIDSTGATTSVSMVQTGLFAGPNSLGDVTGNNSGVYPDAVLEYQYVLFAGNLGSFQLSGLNLSKTYDITFMGSENFEGGNNNTAYIVNGDTVFLNALDNANATVTLRGLVPNGEGQMNISMLSYGPSVAGWFNAMVINGYTVTPRNAPTPPEGTTGGANTSGLWASPTAFAGAAQVSDSVVNADTVVNAYPNPFHTSFTLSIPADYNNQRVMVGIYDVSGHAVYRQEFDNLVQGENYLQIDATQGFALTGIYFVKVTYEGGKVKTFKLLKQ